MYELVGTIAQGTRDLDEWISTYERGLDAYFKQEWDIAETQMKRVLSLRPKDRAAALFVKRIRSFRNNPPGANWDGVARFTKK